LAKVVPDCVLGNTEPLGDFAIPEALGYEPDDVFLPTRQDRPSLFIMELDGFKLKKSIEEMFKILVADPDLSLVHGSYAFREGLQ
jgi:hypothetical protein